MDDMDIDSSIYSILIVGSSIFLGGVGSVLSKVRGNLSVAC